MDEIFTILGVPASIDGERLQRKPPQAPNQLVLTLPEEWGWGPRGSNSPKADYESAAFTRLLGPHVAMSPASSPANGVRPTSLGYRLCSWARSQAATTRVAWQSSWL